MRESDREEGGLAQQERTGRGAGPAAPCWGGSPLSTQHTHTHTHTTPQTHAPHIHTHTYHTTHATAGAGAHLGHADARVGDGEGVVGLVGHDVDVELRVGVQLGLVGQALVPAGRAWVCAASGVSGVSVWGVGGVWWRGWEAVLWGGSGRRKECGGEGRPGWAGGGRCAEAGAGRRSQCAGRPGARRQCRWYLTAKHACPAPRRRYGPPSRT